MKRRHLLQQLGSLASLSAAGSLHAATAQPTQGAGFKPSWDSLASYQTPDWFRDAKFGIWAHWGPQCQPEMGDWYAREMYIEGSAKYRHHVATYGHPSVYGFKEVIRDWKAERWEPEELLSLYKRAGARYFMAMANHHDNFDLYASRRHAWNSTRIGPKQDIIKRWAGAARAQGLPLGVSVHAAHAWTWYEPAQLADKTGAKAGVPYDGRLRKADGRGQWWEGLDPQELYAQDHPLSTHADDPKAIHKQWDWGEGASKPSEAYIRNFLARTLDLLDQHRPELVYFDDTALPLWPISTVGLDIAAHLYNQHLDASGRTQAVLFGKILDEQQRRTMVWDIERGQSDRIEPLPWQTCTCLGAWHYDRRVLERKGYKSAETVIRMLIDVVSKNGNLLLNVPVKGDGRIDDVERRVVEEIGVWMQRHGESIYGTRPWRVFGEGPSLDKQAPLTAQGFNEGKGAAFGAADFRFTARGDVVYASGFVASEGGKALIRSLARGQHRPVQRVDLVGGAEALRFQQRDDGLEVRLPADGIATLPAYVLRIA
ncbi:alpha-L-fucosidase [Roseateles sp.]|uniref:alpha-L-fucosidase n=1 Tax=Roseateles sp. TaxID=1971397 RepID=UPI0039EB4E40